MVQVRVWTLIGNEQTGKSRTIRELASLDPGGGQPGFRLILLRGGGFLNVYCKRMAWQEDKKLPADSVSEITAKAVRLKDNLGADPFSINVLCALHFDQPNSSTYPPAKEYINEWIRAGWSIESIVLMSPKELNQYDQYAQFGAPTAWVYGSTDYDVSQMVGLVRNHFGWA